MFTRARIDRYLQDGLPEAAEDRLRAHLARCPPCRAHYDEQVRLLRALGGDASRPTAAEDERLISLVLRKTGSAPDQAPAPGPRSPGLLERLVWAPSSLLAVAALALVLILVGGALTVGLVLGRGPVVGQLAGARGLRIDGRPVAEAVTKGLAIRQGQVLAVDDAGAAEIELTRGATVRLYPAGRLAIEDGGDHLALLAGKVWCLVERGRGTFRVATDSASATVLGTSFVVDRRSPEETEVRVIEGRVEVRDNEARGRVRLRAGQRSVVLRGAAPQPPRRYLPGLDRAEWRRLWARISRAFVRAGHKLRRLLDEL